MKVQLRALNESDLAQLRLWRNQPEIRRRTREYRLLSDQDQKQWWLKLHSKKPPDDIMFGIVTVEDVMKIDPNPFTNPKAIRSKATITTLVGVCGLCHIDWVNRVGEASIYIGRLELHSKGIGSQTIQQLLKYGFESLNLHKIWVQTYIIKGESLVQFFTKNGFTIDAELRDVVFREGSYWSSHILSILSSEFAALKAVKNHVG